MATIHKDGKYWHAQWTNAQGKRITRSTRCTKKSEAKQKAFEMEQADKASEADLVRAGDATVAERLAQYLDWLETQAFSKAHIRNVRRVVPQVLAKALELNPPQITAEMFMNGLAEAQKEHGWSLPTTRVRRAQTSGFLQWMYRSRIISHNPGDLIKLPTPKDNQYQRPRGVYTYQEIRSLFEHARNSDKKLAGAKGKDREIIYKLAYGLALRRSEVFNLKTSDFIIKNDRVELIRIEGKGGKIRKLPVPEEFQEELKEYLELPREQRKNGKAIPGWDSVFVSEALAHDRYWAGIPEKDDQGRIRDFHSLRSSRLTHLADAGCPPHVLKSLARHSKVETTLAFYTKTSEALQEEWTNRIPFDDIETPSIAAEKRINKDLGL